MNRPLIDSLLSQALKNHEKQNFSEAEKFYENALEEDPNHIICLNNGH